MAIHRYTTQLTNLRHQFLNRYLVAWLVCCCVLVSHLVYLWLTNQQLLEDELYSQQQSYQQTLRVLIAHQDLQLQQIAVQLDRSPASQQQQVAQQNDVSNRRLSLFKHSGDVAYSYFSDLPALSERQLQQLAQNGYFLGHLRPGNGQYLTRCGRFSSAIICIHRETNDYPSAIRAGRHANLILKLYSSDGELLLSDYANQSRSLLHLIGEQVPLRIRNTLTQYSNQPLHASAPENNLDNRSLYRLVSALPAQGLIIETAIPAADAHIYFYQEAAAGLVFWAIASLIIYLNYRRQRLNRLQLATKEQTFIQALNKAESTTSLFINNISGCVYKASYPNYTLMFVTQGSEHIFNLAAEELIQQEYSLLEFLQPEDKDNFLRQTEKHIKEQSKFEFICRLTMADHSHRWVMNRGRIIVEKNGRLAIEGLLLDITDQKLSQQQVEYLATRDPLTELANRYCFNDEIINHINLDHHHQQPFALLFIDLDRFKTINESLGHQVGDRLLKLVAERLRVAVEDQHLLARLGGDEFIIMMMQPADRDEIIRLATRIKHTLGQTFQLDYYKLSISCSIGISTYPDDSTESYVLMQNADTAMYKAKEKGGNSYEFFTNDMNRQVRARLTLENELRKAIKTNQFELHYQPQVSTSNNQLLGAEALIRWNHPERGMISPVEFIPVAEETGLIKDIGDWALNEACATFSDWNRELGLNLVISVNVSARQLDDLFVFRVQDVLKQHNMPAHQLELEITESLLMDNLKENIRLMENISKLGVDFAMDDFGTGYSSLSYLKQFPVRKLKIDRAFVNDITSSADGEGIVRAIIAMAKTLKLKLVAEGVENHQQLSMLSDMNCDAYQGYYFSKPLAKQEFYQQHLSNIDSAATSMLN